MAPPTKRKKLSGLQGLKFTEALDCVFRLKGLMNEYPDEAENEGGAFEQAGEAGELIEQLVKIMTTSAILRSVTFSRTTPGHLNVEPTGALCIPDEKVAEAVSTSRAVAPDDLWSSARTLEHLNFLVRTVPPNCEASTRLLIDAIFFRAAALMPVGSSLLLHLEASVPPTIRKEDTTSLSGITDSLALMVPTNKLATWRSAGNFTLLKSLKPSGLFVAEAKYGPDLNAHLPQAVSEQYACAVQLGKSTMRGVLTNGVEWTFLIVYVNVGGSGGTYRWSTIFEIGQPADANRVELVALALAQSIQNCSEDIQPDELLEWLA
ncbi:hypothetical protein BDZ89DRAFT_1065311 [Hymenopellis radicata]|nr:hypothetical protein BDZ89DRAFT_1065311 [Hymenopellis radicata]